jgi:type IV secretory pathway TrbD component
MTSARLGGVKATVTSPVSLSTVTPMPGSSCAGQANSAAELQPPQEVRARTSNTEDGLLSGTTREVSICDGRGSALESVQCECRQECALVCVCVFVLSSRVYVWVVTW